MVNLFIGVTYRSMDKSKAAASPIVGPSMDDKDHGPCMVPGALHVLGRLLLSSLGGHSRLVSSGSS